MNKPVASTNRKLILAGVIILALVFLLFFYRARLAAPEESGFPASGNQLKVTTSFYPLYFFAQQIGGNRAAVVSITPAGVEPHDYEPTAQDLARLADSRLVILNGGGLEVWRARVANNINPEKTSLVMAGEGLINPAGAADGKNIIDPHVWLSPVLAEQMADRIAAGFIAVDPTGRADYEANLFDLKNKLSALDQEYRAGLAPCARRDIITAHAAFGYLAAAYNLRQVSIAGLSPEAEPAPRALAAMAAAARADQVRYIFFEELTSPKLAETLAREIGAQTLALNPLEGLTPVELAAGQNYFTVMRDNLHNLQIALACQK